MNLLSASYEIDSFGDAQEFYHSRGWTDGFPIVPPVPEAVKACLEWANLPPGELIGVEPVRERVISAEKLAVNAVMAGCLPSHFPLVVTAWTAMLQEEFLLHGATASTGGCAILLIINGPVRLEINAGASFNALGGGGRANAAIGRAIRLGLINLLDVRPGDIDRSTLGHPGKISYCIAEDEENSPWPSLAETRGVPAEVSAVTAFAAGAPRQIMNEWTREPEEILETYAAEMRANMRNYSIWSGNYAIVVPAQHRDILHGAGWSRDDIAQFLHQRARIKRGEWAKVGKAKVVRGKEDEEYCALPAPEDLLILAAGGPAGGFGAIIPPWLGLKSRAVTLPIGACVDCQSEAEPP